MYMVVSFLNYVRYTVNYGAYITLVIFSIAIIYNFFKWFFYPRPVNWALYPAKHSLFSVLLTIVKRIFALPGPRAIDKTVWVLAWVFHVGFVGSALLHMLLMKTPNLFPYENQVGVVLGVMAIVGTLGFIIRRVVVSTSKTVSVFSDYFSLSILLIMVASGTFIRSTQGVSLAAVNAWFTGIFTLHPVLAPVAPVFLLHIALAELYIAYLPFKSLQHPIGILFGQKIILDGRHVRMQGKVNLK